jgi:ring-1,2-phenylacetyl-CoA epoxidase subunit PaaB
MAYLKSLDPRVDRLDIPRDMELRVSKEQTDQLNTFQVFHQMKTGKPLQHVGIVHASDEESGFIYAKELFSRRQTCTGLWVVDSKNIYSTEFTENNINVYDSIKGEVEVKNPVLFQIFHLHKRGKQHVHVGSVEASDYENALKSAKTMIEEPKTVFNVWVVKDKDIFKSDPGDVEIWDTLPDKKYREALDYKAGDKIKEFKSRQKEVNHGS